MTQASAVARRAVANRIADTSSENFQIPLLLVHYDWVGGIDWSSKHVLSGPHHGFERTEVNCASPLHAELQRRDANSAHPRTSNRVIAPAPELIISFAKSNCEHPAKSIFKVRCRLRAVEGPVGLSLSPPHAV